MADRNAFKTTKMDRQNDRHRKTERGRVVLRVREGGKERLTETETEKEERGEMQLPSNVVLLVLRRRRFHLALRNIFDPGQDALNTGIDAGEA